MGKPKDRSWAFVFFVLVVLGGAVYLSRGYWKPLVGKWVKPADSTTVLTPPAGTGITVSLGEQKAAEFLGPYLEETLQARLETLTFRESKINVAVVLNVSRLIDETVAKAMPELAMVKAVLPAEASVAMEFTPTVKDGSPYILPNACKIGGYSIPVGLVPMEVIDALNRMIENQISSYGVNITSIAANNGILTITIA